MCPEPAYTRSSVAVWEVTLKCNLACSHCGSRAGTPRLQELSLEEALDLVQQLADVGIGEVALIGGEAYLRSDWLEIASAIVAAGMVCSMTTGGYGLSATTARRMKDAGIRHVSVSVDGLQPAHDRLRGRPGSFTAAMTALRHLSDAGILTGANTQINRITAPDLPCLYVALAAARINAWQIQFTVASGNAADHPDLLLQPCELIDVYEVLAEVALHALSDGIDVMPGNNVGYHGPYTSLFIAAGASPGLGAGCTAGQSVLGIEADGAIKGCPSLPVHVYAGGNIRHQRLREILSVAESSGSTLFARTPRERLWGFCKGCHFADPCRGGCTWTAHAFFDRPGNNPYCHHRALALAEAGRRERLVQVAKPPGTPFDNGRFEIVEEPIDAPWPDVDDLRFTADRVMWPLGWSMRGQHGECGRSTLR